MKRIRVRILALASLIFLGFGACTDDLDQSPDNDNLIASDAFFSNPESYKQYLAKLYAGLATSGQSGPAGSSDITGIDEGFGQYMRGYWNLQELTTDEAIIAWNDQTIKDLHYQTWTSLDVFINAFFSRVAFQVTSCNEFLRQTTDEKLNSRGVSDELRAQIKIYRAEARFLRALTYWHIVDMFGGASLETEESSTAYHVPTYASRQELFDFVESELNSLEADLVAPNTNEQYRVDKAAAWMLKAKLLMNAKVYVGTDRYAEALTEIEKVINQSSYALHDNYRELFLADNGSNGAQNEMIYSISYDGLYTKTYGGTTYLVHAPVGGSMAASDFGVNGGWGGIRTTSAFVDKFNGQTGDQRNQFYTSGQSLEIQNVGNFTDGYAIAKWRNVTSEGAPGSDANGDFVDTDFPMFRMADAYLMYAECVARGAGGSTATAVNLINNIRQRAYGNSNGNITAGQLTLDFILDERGRELHWEGHRRTDLIRFGKFTGGAYIWPWKGNVPGGSPTPSYRNLFPIPANALSANPNLQQNPGY